jgi:hypothetical protein
MNTKGLINSAKTRTSEAEKLAVRKAGPAPLAIEPAATIAPPNPDAVTAAANEAVEAAREKVLAAAREATQAATQAAENAKRQAAADAKLKAMINEHNDLEIKRFQLEAAIMQALLQRRGSIVRYGMGGQVMTQLYHADWPNQHAANVLLVESLGSL